MAPTPSLRVVKSFSWKGNTRLWSNRYHFNGGTPADNSHWGTLMDNVTTAEKAALTPVVTIVSAVAYNAGSEIPVYSKSYSLAGTTVVGGSPTYAQGESVILLRWATAARSSKNHPIYLYNYYHGACTNGGTSPDLPFSTQKTNVQTYAAAWISGFSDGTTTYVRAGPNGATATGSLVETYLTHRDFPR